jgi:hypothetical protein
MGPTLGFDTKQRNSFFDQIWWFFFNKNKILTILFIVNYEKTHLNDEFLELLGPIISRFFCMFNKEKNKPKQQRVRALVLSLWETVNPEAEAQFV